MATGTERALGDAAKTEILRVHRPKLVEGMNAFVEVLSKGGPALEKGATPVRRRRPRRKSRPRCQARGPQARSKGEAQGGGGHQDDRVQGRVLLQAARPVRVVRLGPPFRTEPKVPRSSPSERVVFSSSFLTDDNGLLFPAARPQLHGSRPGDGSTRASAASCLLRASPSQCSEVPSLACKSSWSRRKDRAALEV